MPAADAALIGDRERPALHFLKAHLAFARARREVLQLLRQLEQALLVRVAQHRHEQARVRVHRDAEVKIIFENHLARRLVNARVERRVLLQRRDDGLQREGSQRQIHPLGLIGGDVLFAQLEQRRDVRVVELRHVRDRVPVLRHPVADHLAQLRQRLARHRPPLREINRLDHRRRSRGSRARRGLRALRRRVRDEFFEALNVRAQIRQHDASATFAAANFREFNAQLPREQTNRRRGRGRMNRLRRLRGNLRRIVARGFRFRRRDHRRSPCWRGCGRGRLTRDRQRQHHLAHRHAVAFLHANRGDRARGRRGNRRHGLLIFQLENGLALGHLLACFDQNADHDTRLGTFAQFRQFNVHKHSRPGLRNRESGQ